jgi:hypothetical protein
LLPGIAATGRDGCRATLVYRRLEACALFDSAQTDVLLNHQDFGRAGPIDDDELVTRDLNVMMNIGDELQRRLPAYK